MKNLKLLNKKYLLIILVCLHLGFSAQSEEVVDIWNVENKKSTKKNIIDKNKEQKNIPKNSIFEMQTKKNNQINIAEDQTLISKDVKIIVEKQTVIKINGVDKELVSKVASDIKSLKPVEPYKGKGIKIDGNSPILIKRIK